MKDNERYKLYRITPALELIDLRPPIPGYEQFIGAYLFHGEKNALIDVGPGVAIPNLLAALGELRVSPAAIDYVILTHIHIDHAGGVGMAIKAMVNARVIAHSRARPHLIDPARLRKASLATLGQLARDYGDIEPVPPDRIIDAADLMKLDLGGGLVLEIYLTPGHAPHHLSIFERNSGVLVAGEIAGVCVDGRIRPATPPPFRLAEALASIDRLVALQPGRLCYGHFGCYDQAVPRLEAMRRKLLEWHQIIGPAAKMGKTPEDILSLLREKDRGLDYLSGLSGDEYWREHLLLINSISGLQSAGELG